MSKDNFHKTPAFNNQKLPNFGKQHLLFVETLPYGNVLIPIRRQWYTMLSNLIKRYKGLTEAYQSNAEGVIDSSALSSILARVESVCIVASGNSTYPAGYLQLLLNGMDGAPPVFCMTPLEYIAEKTGRNHACILVSYGVKNIDSAGILNYCIQNGTPLFLITGDHSRKLPIVEKIVGTYGENHIFSGNLPSQEKGFISILGTTAIFATCFKLACSLGLTPSDTPEAITFPDNIRFDDVLKPLHTDRMVLHGPLGRPAALALAGFHTETMNPLMTYDLKNVTHGVWRTLQDTGPYSLYVIRDTFSAPLADYITSRLGFEHQCIVIQNTTSVAHWSLEAVGLYASALEAFGSACVERRERDPKWNPLFVSMNDYNNCKGLISQFSIFDMASPEGLKNDS